MQLECVLFAFMLTSFGLLQIVFDFYGIQTDLFGEVEGKKRPKPKPLGYLEASTDSSDN
jgi:hypothetical protein